ncbi:hypothetical protein FE633_30650 [Streptomyces montanus]|uniref:Uncharacterized protein n=1 Tax=Streptomyces montanus TaxID=2580423 RepID=A0A5R9FFI0_9ACTN|nr:hypothetical protein FE633_30650 [Streptomyces montanus]
MWSTVGPIAVGRRVFRPSRPDRVEDETVGRIQKIRTAVGLAAVVGVMLAYRLVDSAEGVASDRGKQAWLSICVLAATFPVVVGGFIAMARPPVRRELLRRTAKPIGSLVALFAAMATFPFAVLTASQWTLTPAVKAAVIFGNVLIFLWVLPFVVYGVAMSLVHVFRTADIHEVVPPLLATVLVWEMAVLDVVNGAYEGAPFIVRVVFVLGAPVSVTAVALWELRRLRTLHALTIRGALMR